MVNTTLPLIIFAFEYYQKMEYCTQAVTISRADTLYPPAIEYLFIV